MPVAQQFLPDGVVFIHVDPVIVNEAWLVDVSQVVISVSIIINLNVKPIITLPRKNRCKVLCIQRPRKVISLLAQDLLII